jgi:hypothetical protein
MIHKLQPRDTLISFNYDTLAERLAERQGIALRHSSDRISDAVRFAKPHGSASWNLYDLSPLKVGLPLRDSIDEGAIKAGILKPLLLGAVPMKSELIREVQWCNRVPGVF